MTDIYEEWEDIEKSALFRQGATLEDIGNCQQAKYCREVGPFLLEMKKYFDGYEVVEINGHKHLTNEEQLIEREKHGII